MKQLGLGIIQYCQDYDDLAPCGVLLNYPTNPHNTMGAGWAGTVYPYVKNAGIFSCPDDPAAGTSGVSSGQPTFPVSYAYNGNILCDASNNVKEGPIGKLASPAVTVALMEVAQDDRFGIERFDLEDNEALNGGAGGYRYSPMCSGVFYCQNSPVNNSETISTGPLGTGAGGAGWSGSGGPILDPKFPTGRHLDGSNFLMWDGHVKWLTGHSVSPGTNASSATATETVGDVLAGATGSSQYGQAAGTQGKLLDGSQPQVTFSIF